MYSYVPATYRTAYRDALASVYRRSLRVSLLTRDGASLADLTRRFVDGQVIVDNGQDVTRSCNLQILDWRRELGFDADTYQGHPLQLATMAKVSWVIDSRYFAKPLTVPVFCGPLVRLRRDGPVVTLEAQGREAYGLTPSRRTLTIKKGARRTDAIKTILRHRMGDARLGGIPDLPHRLPNAVTVGPKDLPWKKALSIAGSLDRQLFYGADGVVYLRPRSTEPAWTFRGDQPISELTSPVSTTADLQSVKNVIVVTGATPKGKKTPVSAEAIADRAHPLSPWSLGPNDAPMYLVEEVSNPHLRTAAECRNVAQQTLARRLQLIHETSFNALPVPHLEPRDRVRVITNYESVETYLDTFTLPLGSGDMTVGYVDPYRLKKRGKK